MPNIHSTVLIQDEEGGEACKGHVISDQNKQEVGLFSRYIQILYDNEMANVPNSQLVESGSD